MTDDQKPKALIMENSPVLVPVREEVQDAFERWMAENKESLAEVLAPFGLSPDHNVAMPTLERIVFEGDERYTKGGTR